MLSSVNPRIVLSKKTFEVEFSYLTTCRKLFANLRAEKQMKVTLISWCVLSYRVSCSSKTFSNFDK